MIVLLSGEFNLKVKNQLNKSKIYLLTNVATFKIVEQTGWPRRGKAQDQIVFNQISDGINRKPPDQIDLHIYFVPFLSLFRF